MEINIIHSDPEMQAFWEDLKSETHRGLAVLGHAYLDELLKEVLKLRLVNNNEFINFLEKRATFKQKITLCYTTGAICKEAFEDLNNINWVRNKFAHDRKLKSFEDRKNIKTKCDNLHVIKWYRKRDIVHDKTETKYKYLIAISFYMSSLNLKSKKYKQIEENKDYRRVFG